MNNKGTFYWILLGLIILFTASIGYSQSPNKNVTSNELYNKIKALDSSLFAIAYTCNTVKISAFFTEDLEFYHDKVGLMANSRQAFLELNEKRFCGEQHGFKLRRELVPGSMKVYPLADYGAVQTGTHRFYQITNGQKEELVEIGKFTMIWVFKNGDWRISRIISYDHQEIK